MNYLQILWDASNRSTSSCCGNKRVQLSTCLLPKLWSCSLIVSTEICQILKLVCKETPLTWTRTILIILQVASYRVLWWGGCMCCQWISIGSAGLWNSISLRQLITIVSWSCSTSFCLLTLKAWEVKHFLITFTQERICEAPWKHHMCTVRNARDAFGPAMMNLEVKI